MKVRRTGPGLKAISVGAKELDGLRGKVGIFESTKYPSGTPGAYVAAIHEFGAPSEGIPPRPFMRPTIAEQSPEWTKQFGAGAKAIAEERFSAADVMETVAALAAGDVRKTIASIQDPPLKEATIEARKRRYKNRNKTGNLTKPLVDTAVMVNAVTHVVERGK